MNKTLPILSMLFSSLLCISNHYEESQRVAAILFDHTHLTQAASKDISQPEPVEGDFTSEANFDKFKSLRLTKHQKGLAFSLSVQPGDTVEMEVFAKYVLIPRRVSCFLQALCANID